MNSLIEILEEEYQLLENLSKHIEMQKNALIKYDISVVERETNKILEYLKKIRAIEEERINFLAQEMKIPKREALKIKLSQIPELAEGQTVSKLLDGFSKLIPRIVSTNSLNNLLANRALNSLGEILSFLSNGNISVCDVKV